MISWELFYSEHLEIEMGKKLFNSDCSQKMILEDLFAVIMFFSDHSQMMIFETVLRGTN